MNFHPLRASALALAVTIGVAGSATMAQAETKLKLVLNWKYQGPQGWFFLAKDWPSYFPHG